MKPILILSLLAASFVAGFLVAPVAPPPIRVICPDHKVATTAFTHESPPVILPVEFVTAQRRPRRRVRALTCQVPKVVIERSKGEWRTTSQGPIGRLVRDI